MGLEDKIKQEAGQAEQKVRRPQAKLPTRRSARPKSRLKQRNRRLKRKPRANCTEVILVDLAQRP